MFQKAIVIVFSVVLFGGGVYVNAADLANRPTGNPEEKQDINLGLSADGFVPPVNCLPINTGMIESIITNTGHIGSGYTSCNCGVDGICPSFMVPP